MSQLIHMEKPPTLGWRAFFFKNTFQRFYLHTLIG